MSRIGGENIFPAEIEERIVQHPVALQACVVGVKDSKYGELVGAFIQENPENGEPRPSPAGLADWVSQTLARHKVPVYFWWLGDQGVPSSFPQTASGKIQKVVLRDIAAQLTGQKS